jgi:hypothetical protein
MRNAWGHTDVVNSAGECTLDYLIGHNLVGHNLGAVGLCAHN